MMNKDEVNQLIDVLKAFKEGRPIQAFIKNEWVDVNTLYKAVLVDCPLRIKPAPMLRSYTYDELKEELPKHKSPHVVWGSEVVSIGGFTPTQVGIVKHRGMTDVGYAVLCCMKWLDDNTPCCVIEQS